MTTLTTTNNRELTEAELLAVCGSAKAGSWHSTNKTVVGTTTGGLGSVSSSISGGTSV
jgi:hypothetical protein